MKTVETQIRINQNALTQQKPDGFAFPLALKGAGATREYKFDTGWSRETPSKEKKPQGVRIVFDTVENFRAARDVYFAWQDIKTLRVDDPVRPEETVQRLMNARTTNQPLTLFVPWGVRPEGKRGTAETETMDKLKAFQYTLVFRNIPTKLMLMPADLYATEVNNISKEKTDAYFTWIKELAEERRFSYKPWSEIRAENQTYYTKRAEELTRKTIEDMFIPAKILEALDTARRRSGYDGRYRAEEAAFAYLRERLIEAEIVESVYKPVKVSCVTKNKDNGVDVDLPRLYCLPDESRFPWLKKN